MNKEDFTYDYLPGTDIYLYQHKHMFRNNTDTALLGQFMRVRKSDDILDIGTNNGALLLYANRFRPRSMTGVDINAEACRIATYNMAHHHIENAQILHGDILEMKLPLYTCIVCNPPYFKVEDAANVNVNADLSKARHELHLDLSSLLQCCQRLLQDRGRLYMVHRADRFIDIACMMRAHGLEIKGVQFVFDEAKEDARSVLIEGMKNGKPGCRIWTPKVIKREVK